MGIEPTSKAWEAFILPLNYTRNGPTIPNLILNFAEEKRRIGTAKPERLGEDFL